MKKIASLFFLFLIILLPVISTAEYSSAGTSETHGNDADFEEARAIANFMETHYEITVRIGPECENIPVPDWFTLGDKPKGRSPFLDLLGAYNYTREIQRIDDAFSIYPPEFFTLFKCNDAPKGLRILLPLQILDGDISMAGTVTADDGYYNLFLAVGMFNELNIHHEIWHAMEYRITAEDPHAFDRWTEFNPEGFEYIGEHHTQDPWEATASPDDWFAREYGKVADYEDRATTIEALFRHDPDWWSTRPRLQKKLDYLLEVIKPLFGNVYFYE